MTRRASALDRAALWRRNARVEQHPCERAHVARIAAARFASRASRG